MNTWRLSPRVKVKITEQYAHYIVACKTGFLRGLFGLPFEHPLDVIKTHRQVKPCYFASHIAREIYSESGIRGFYKGVTPNGLRVSIKQAYRFPLMLYMPSFFKRYLPGEVLEKYPTSPKVFTGFSIACLETGVVGPLERMKVWLITKEKKQTLRSLFVSENGGSLTRTLGAGINAVFARQVVSWVSFLAANAKFAEWERQKYPDRKQMSYFSLMKVGLEVGVVNTACVMPFDTAKTLLQKASPEKNCGIVSIMRKVIRKDGVRGLYAGWQLRLAQYVLHSFFTVPVLDRLEQNHKNREG